VADPGRVEDLRESMSAVVDASVRLRNVLTAVAAATASDAPPPGTTTT